MNVGDLAIKFASYACYIASSEWTVECSLQSSVITRGFALIMLVQCDSWQELPVRSCTSRGKFLSVHCCEKSGVILFIFETPTQRGREWHCCLPLCVENGH
jgi:hypothetical protein